MVLSFPPRYSISQVMGITKQNTGKVMKEEFDFIKKKYYGRGGLQSVGYFASIIGFDEQMIINYVKYQQK